MTTHLFIIDAQQDFCDGPCNGALAVPGAHDDMMRLSDFITRHGDKIDAIHASMDRHRFHDIAHPSWWVDENGNPPAPFTIITSEDLRTGKWTTRDITAFSRSRQYVNTLEMQGNYPLCIWPPHCLIGSQGHSLHPAIFAAITEWEAKRARNVNYVLKGENPWTEHYSALRAEVPDMDDPRTLLNMSVVANVRNADTIILAGEALSHCVRTTVTDLANAIGSEYIEKFVFLTDASTSVPGFEHYGEEFYQEMTEHGMRLSTTVDFIP